MSFVLLSEPRPPANEPSPDDPSGIERDVDDPRDKVFHDKSELKATHPTCHIGAGKCRRKRELDVSIVITKIRNRKDAIELNLWFSFQYWWGPRRPSGLRSRTTISTATPRF